MENRLEITTSKLILNPCMNNKEQTVWKSEGGSVNGMQYRHHTCKVNWISDDYLAYVL